MYRNKLTTYVSFVLCRHYNLYSYISIDISLLLRFEDQTQESNLLCFNSWYNLTYTYFRCIYTYLYKYIIVLSYRYALFFCIFRITIILCDIICFYLLFNHRYNNAKKKFFIFFYINVVVFLFCLVFLLLFFFFNLFA